MSGGPPRWFRERVPLRGPHLAVQWSTHNDGTHLALARSEAALCGLWGHLLRKRRQASAVQVDGCWTMTFVDPPEDCGRGLDGAVFSEVCDSFKVLLGQAAFGLDPYGVELNLPAPLAECSEYEPTLRGADPGCYRNPAYSHEYCANCAGGLQLAGVPASEQGEAWARLLLRPEVAAAAAACWREKLAPRPESSGGPEPTHVVVADLGHHCRGLVLLGLPLPDSGVNWPGQWRGLHPERVLAFARAEPAQIPAVLQLLRGAQAAEEREDAELKSGALLAQERSNEEYRQAAADAMRKFLSALSRQ